MSQVRQSFNRAASSYDAVGTLQHQVARALSTLVSQTLPVTLSGNLLDAGSGTGYCLEDLRNCFNDARFIAVDFAERMLQSIPEHPETLRVSADLQTLPIASGTINAYLSSLAWQWCDPALAAKEATRILKPQGDLFVSTLLSGTFHELAHGLQACSLNPDQHLLRCASSAQIQSALAAADIEILSLASTQITTWHENFKALRHSIRGVGANHSPNQTTPMLTRHTLTQLVEAYEGLRTSRGLPLSYEVLTIHARKR